MPQPADPPRTGLRINLVKQLRSGDFKKELTSVPASVTTLITSGKLPPEFTAFFTPAAELTEGTGWSHVASAVDEYLAAGGVDENLRGALALAGAYGRLDDLEDSTDPDDMDASNGRVVELLEEAEANGVAEDETSELWWYSEHIRSLAAKMSDQIAEISPWDSEFSGCFDRIDVGWCRLLHDAARVDGPEAALLGTGVTDIIEVIIEEWLKAAEEAGRSDLPVTEDEYRIFELALAEAPAA
ncbi:hypothetical protein ACWY4P_41745 [Streptomyces sp. LZ34]